MLIRNLISVLALSGCVKTPPAFPVSDLAKWPDTEDGIVYALPRTVFVFQATGTLVERKEPLCNFDSVDKLPEAERQTARQAAQNEVARALGYADWNVGLEANPSGRTFALKDAKLTTRTEPDPGAIFVSAYRTSGLADSSLKVTLGPEGTFQASEASAADKVLPVVAKTIEVGAGIVSGIFPFMAGAATPTNTSDSPVSEVCKSFVSDLDKVKSQKKTLYSMNTPMPKDTFELLLAEIRVAEEELKARYFGKAEVSSGLVTCELAPDKSGDFAMVAFSRAGIEPTAKNAPADKEAAKPSPKCTFPASFQSEVVGEIRRVNLRLEAVTTPIQNVSALRPAVDDPGFFYRVPGVAWVSVSGPKLEVLPTRHVVPQLGHIARLPRAKGGNPKMVVELHPDTGALKSVLYERKASDFPAAIGSVGTGITALLAAEQARQAAADPLLALQYEQALLEAEIAIHDAKATIDSWNVD